jgi:hypothetical protein
MGINLKGRNENRRPTRKRILIVCEGAKTEPDYFNSFRVPKQVCQIQGLGSNTISLVNSAKRLKDQGDYSEVWCVFDRDSFPKKNVLAALSLADKLGFKCAFSNESFELWYILHFCYLDTQITRHDYCARLSDFLKSPYKKNNPLIYDLLQDRQATAIRNSEVLEKAMCKPGVSPYDARPHTTVHRLVKRLNKLAKAVGR